MNELIELFKVFFRIGGFTFGGGYAMLPIIQEEIVTQRGWASNDEIIDYYAIGQCTPGIIAVNTATFIGYNRKGIPGALAATMGVVTPSLIIISIIARFFIHFQDYEIVQTAFSGIQIVVVALIGTTVFNLGKQAIKDKLGILIFIVSIIASIVFKLSPIAVIITAALAGILRWRNLEIREDR